VLKLETDRDQSSDFNFISVSASYDNKEVFTLSGKGDATFNTGDVDVLAGSMTVNNGNGLSIFNKDSSTSPAISATSNGGGAHLFCQNDAFASEVLSLNVKKKGR
tara:strand:+ start:349 stop:663 length:315 start_codon:yes stop_codon:yes gene_type:complete